MNIPLDSLTPEDAHYLEYYGTMAEAKKEEMRFEALAKMLGAKK